MLLPSCVELNLVTVMYCGGHTLYMIKIIYVNDSSPNRISVQEVSQGSHLLPQGPIANKIL